MSRYTALLAASFVAAAVLSAQEALPPVRVFDSARGALVDLERMAADLATADVAFIGEVHDNQNTHALELAVLESLARRRGDVILSLEMFERDAQEPLDHFLMGHLSEEEFRQQTRPWPRYQTDYKPLVQVAASHDWPVIAANIPRALATKVVQGGLDGLAASSDEDKKLFAKDVECQTSGSYYDRFVKELGGHSGSTDRYYQAQCVKDETMAESIAQAYSVGSIGGKRPLVVHITGSFHSDFREGTVERTARRLPGRHLVVVSVVPVEKDKWNVPAPDVTERKRADYIVYTNR
jgi:uncharacterized iron-regulated protein